jgi:hypothetical protein
MLPEDCVAELMSDLFGVRMAAATIANTSRTCAERLRGFTETVAIAGKTQRLHVASTAFQIWPSKSRMLGPGSATTCRTSEAII